MAKLSGMPAAHIIQSYKKILDFYEWKGIPVCRRWPRSPGRLRNPAVMATSARFSYISSQPKNLSTDLITAYHDIPSNVGWTWKDFMVSFWFKGRKRVSLIPPE